MSKLQTALAAVNGRVSDGIASALEALTVDLLEDETFCQHVNAVLQDKPLNEPITLAPDHAHVLATLVGCVLLQTANENDDGEG